MSEGGAGGREKESTAGRVVRGLGVQSREGKETCQAELLAADLLCHRPNPITSGAGSDVQAAG